MVNEKFQIFFENTDERTNFLNFINQKYEKEIKIGNLVIESDYDSQFLGETAKDIILIITSLWSILHPILIHYKKKKIQRIVNLTTGEVIEKLILEEEI